MLRAVRFAAQLGFTIEKETEKAVHKLAPTLEKISRERIQAELNKLLLSIHPEYICKVYQTELSKFALPDTETFLKEKVQKKAVRILKSIPANPILRWAGFLSFCTEAEHFGEIILKGLKFDNHTIEYVSKLVKYLPQEAEPEEVKIRFALHEMGEEIYLLYLVLKKEELKAEREEAEETMQPYWRNKLKLLEETESLSRMILNRGDCISLKMLTVTGKDLIAEGIPAGKKLGRILNELLYLVLENPTKNNRDYLLTYAKKQIIK